MRAIISVRNQTDAFGLSFKESSQVQPRPRNTIMSTAVMPLLAFCVPLSTCK